MPLIRVEMPLLSNLFPHVHIGTPLHDVEPPQPTVKLKVFLFRYFSVFSLNFPRIITWRQSDFPNIEMSVDPTALLSNTRLLLALVSQLTIILFLNILVHTVYLLQ